MSKYSPGGRAGSDHLTDLVRVEVLLDEAINDVGYLGAQHQVAGGHQVGAEQFTKFLKFVFCSHSWIHPLKKQRFSKQTSP